MKACRRRPSPAPLHPRLGSAVPMAAGRATFLVGVLCQAPSPLPPGALDAPSPSGHPLWSLGCSGVGVTLPVSPLPQAGQHVGGWQEGTAVAVGTMATEGNVPKNETCSALAWQRGTGTPARPPPRRGGRGDTGWSNAGWPPATAWLQHPWEVAPIGGGGICGGWGTPRAAAASFSR